MGSDAVERRLAAILSADAVGYSGLMAQDEVATLKTLNACRDAIGSTGTFLPICLSGSRHLGQLDEIEGEKDR